MAKDKKGFVLYADQKELFTELSDSEAGQLIKHILKYVNDENPEPENQIVKISFIPIKQQLKRDLQKWDKIREKRSLAGKASAEKRQQNSTKATHVESVQQNSTNPTVSVNDNVSVNVNVNDNVKVNNKENTNGEKPPVYIFSFKNELLKLGVDKQIIEDWLKVRKLKKAKDTITSFQNIENQIKKSGLSANECIKIAVEKDWKGFNSDWIKTTNTNNSTNFIKRPNDSDY